MDILVFGNLLVEGDNIPIRLIPKLKGLFPEINFVEIDPTEEIQSYGKELKIIDAVKGIDKVREIKLSSLEDFGKIDDFKIYSMHDFDLGFNLKLLRKMNLINSVKIICVPYFIAEKKALSQIQLILRKWVAQDMQGS